jgi:hypothetical protein
MTFPNARVVHRSLPRPLKSYTLADMRKGLIELFVGTLILLGSITAATRGASLGTSIFNFTVAGIVLSAGLIDLYVSRVESHRQAR